MAYFLLTISRVLEKMQRTTSGGMYAWAISTAPQADSRSIYLTSYDFG